LLYNTSHQTQAQPYTPFLFLFLVLAVVVVLVVVLVLSFLLNACERTKKAPIQRHNSFVRSAGAG